MERHIKTQHSVFSPIYGKNQVNSPKSALIPNWNESSQYKIKHGLVHRSENEPFPGFTEMENNVKRMKELANNMQTIRTFYPPNMPDLQGQLNSVTTQLNNIMSNCMIVPKDQIFGISGHYCKRCQRFASHFVRDPGYDMTAEKKHRCDENKVRSIHAVSIRPSDVASTDNFCARVLLNSVNFFIPNTKYLKCLEFTVLFNELSCAFNSEIAKGLLGIAERFPLYTFNKPEKPDWLKRSVENLDKKTPIKEDEVIDFLGKVKSSYAMFEILNEPSPRLVFLCLVQ
jgi:hypothetical protein